MERAREGRGDKEQALSNAIILLGKTRCRGMLLSGLWEHLPVSPPGPSWSRHCTGAGSIERCRGLAQSLIERNHSTLKGVQAESIPPGRGGRAGGAGRWPCPSAGSAGRAQAVAAGFAAQFSAAER